MQKQLNRGRLNAAGQCSSPVAASLHGNRMRGLMSLPRVASGFDDSLSAHACTTIALENVRSAAGENWRTEQLAHQIPHQDIKLLTSSPIDCDQDSASSSVGGSNTTIRQQQHHNHHHQSLSDEIKFIRGQRKMASQFKASLYYLNPTRMNSEKQAIGPGSKQQQQQQQQLAEQNGLPASQKQHHQVLTTNKKNSLKDIQHTCFKCKKSIELGTTCVRVDNLIQRSDMANNKTRVSGKEETQNCLTEQDVATMPNMIKTTTKFSSHGNSKRQQQASKTSNAIVQREDDKILSKQASGAAAQEGARSSSSATTTTTTTESGKSNSHEEKTSSDEGLGSGGSSSCGSAQSSTAGSHCDDRETPPHIDTTTSPASASSPTGGPTSQSNGQKCLFTCDNKNELSLDSLNRSGHHEFPANGYCTDSNSSSSTSAKKKRDKSQASRKSRTLTWSASLGSIGATLKFGTGMSSSKSKSRSETNLKVVESSSEVDSQLNVNDHAIDADNDAEEVPILYHTDCFTCTTCNELLVDLRALIYVNDFPMPAVSLSSNQKQQQQQQFKAHLHDAEYVNIPNSNASQETNDCHGVPRYDDAKSKQQQQISLYCHRHFVELFKPRCQQCDCLILDEECTEAEGKVWHIKHFCCADCKVPLGGHQYIIVDQALNQARQQQQQQQQQQRKDKTRPEAGSTRSDNFAAAANSTNGKPNNNQPYCLACFDRIFGETCVQCGKLITCDSGAINHEQRSWHASASCFKCQHCLKSLLGCPFLPSQDGKIYCSINCSELSLSSSLAQASSSMRPSHLQHTATGKSKVNMSLPHYLDPRAMPSAIQHELEMNKTNGGGLLHHQQRARQQTPLSMSTTTSAGASQQSGHRAAEAPVGTGEQKAPALNSLLRHKSLIDYLIANARIDETSYQLLSYLQTQFKRSLEYRQQQQQLGQIAHRNIGACGMQDEFEEETKLIEHISCTLKSLNLERHVNGGANNKPADNKSTKSLTSADGATIATNLEERRNKLNPFLIDSNQQQQQSGLVCSMMSQALNGAGESQCKLASDQHQALANYINLDCFELAYQKSRATAATAPPSLASNADGGHAKRQTAGDCVDNAAQQTQGMHQQHIQVHHSRLQQQHHGLTRLSGIQYQHQSKLSQCSPVASLISNEGTMSDHSGTSSGVSTAPPGNDSANGSLKSHSPLSSTSSHSSVSSHSSSLNPLAPVGSLARANQHQTNGTNASGTNATSGTAPATGSPSSVAEGSAASSSTVSRHQQAQGIMPLQSMNGRQEEQLTNQNQQHQHHINSIAASLERRRRVQPITELSVVDLLAVADDQMHLNQRPANDGFDRLVSQFDTTGKRQQQAPATPPSSSLLSSLHKLSGVNKLSASGKQQPDSFFFELAQRLPKGRNSAQSTSSSKPKQQLQSIVASGCGGVLRIATAGPLDTNGLPTVESVDDEPAPRPQVQQITDHYSTVNKAHKTAQRQRDQSCSIATLSHSGRANGNEQQVATESATEQQQQRQERAGDEFFAIASSRISGDGPTSTTASLGGQLDEASRQALHPSQIIRPTSSLSIFAGPEGDATANQVAHQQQQQHPHSLGLSSLHGSYSTSSLNRPLTSQDTSQLLLQPTSCLAAQKDEQQQQQQQQQQKPLTRPAKSVSFDPNVKDPPSSGGSMTLGRGSALKSALKQQQQQQYNQFQQVPAAWQQHFMDQSASSATMPASFAAQLKAANSMAAYSAHYDEFGRRIRLSTLMQQQQAFGGPPDQSGQLVAASAGAGLNECQLQQVQQQQPTTQASSETTRSSPLSFLLGSSLLSKIAGQPSRGGRREERNLRQQQQQQHAPTGIQTCQPTSSLTPDEQQILFAQQQQQQALALQQQQQPSTSGTQTQQRPTRRRSASTSGSERRRLRHSGSSRRPYPSRRRRQRPVRRRSSYGSKRTGQSSSSSKCSSRYCRNTDYSSDDYSSQCSTCSSVSYQSDLDDSEVDHRTSCSSSSGDDDDCNSSYSYDSRDEFSSYTSSESESELSSDADENEAENKMGNRDAIDGNAETQSPGDSSRSESPCSSHSGESRSSSRSNSPVGPELPLSHQHAGRRRAHRSRSTSAVRGRKQHQTEETDNGSARPSTSSWRASSRSAQRRRSSRSSRSSDSTNNTSRSRRPSSSSGTRSASRSQKDRRTTSSRTHHGRHHHQHRHDNDYEHRNHHRAAHSSRRTSRR